MEDKIENISATFRIYKIELNSFQESIPSEIQIPDNYKDFTFEINVGSGISFEDKLIRILTECKIYFDSDKKISLAKINTTSIYEVLNLKEIMIKNENEIKLPEFLMAALIGISLSTTRGMLISKAGSPIIQNAFIPVVNPQDFLKTNTTFLTKEKEIENVNK